MSDREAFETVASEIAQWELVAQQLPLPELYAVATTCQNDLAAEPERLQRHLHQPRRRPTSRPPRSCVPWARSPGGPPPWRSSPSASPSVRT